jgi:hypothetical protein
METERFIDEPEERVKIYYAVFLKTTGQLVYLVGGTGWLVPIERIIQNVVDSDKDGLWNEDLQDYVITPKYDKDDLICVQITDTDLADNWAWNHSFRTDGKAHYHDLINSMPQVGEKKVGQPVKAMNRKDETGVPPGHSHVVRIAKTQVRRPVQANKAGVVLEGWAGEVRRINPKDKSEKIKKQLRDEPACRLEIVCKGTFDSPYKQRIIYLVRYDGKLVGRCSLKDDDLSFECTWYDYCRGQHTYQLQLESPKNGDTIIDPSMILEEVANYYKPRKQITVLDSPNP